MIFNLSVAEIVAFIAFVTLVAPALMGVGYLLQRVKNIDKRVADHDERTQPLMDKFFVMVSEFERGAAQRDRIENKLDGLTARLEDHIGVEAHRWRELDVKVATLDTRVQRVERLLNGGIK